MIILSDILYDYYGLAYKKSDEMFIRMKNQMFYKFNIKLKILQLKLTMFLMLTTKILMYVKVGPNR